jgi:DNA-directed RNA polymerase subunit alpha
MTSVDTGEKKSPKNLLKGLKRPRVVEFHHVESKSNYGKFIAEPFEKGFGVTIGNALRRVLMSYIEGAGIVAIKIDGISHEFSTISGVAEDVSRIILNLKKVRVKYESAGPITVDIDKTGPGLLLASDLGANSSLEIVNPDLVLAHLNEEAHIKMTLQIDKGRGYLPSETTKKMIDEVGVIAIDALFSPITKVNFEVVETRVDQITLSHLKTQLHTLQKLLKNT